MAADRFSPPPSPESAALGRIEAALSALTERLTELSHGPAPQVHVEAPTVTAPAVDVTVPTEGLTQAIAEAMYEAMAAMPAPTINVPPPSGGGDGGLGAEAIAALLDSLTQQHDVMSALKEKVTNLVGGQRSHFDGRLRTDTGLISSDNPLAVRDTRFPDSSTFGEQTSVSHFHEQAAKFYNPIAEEPVTPATSGDGAITQPIATPGQARIAASTGTAALQFTSAVPYRSGHETRGLFTTSFVGTAGAGVTRRAGLFSADTTSGYWFGDVDGVWSVGRIYNSVETVVAATLPTLTYDDGTTAVMDPTKPHIFRFRFGWLGYDGLTIEVHNAGERTDELWVPLHTFYFVNRDDTDPSLSLPDTVVRMAVDNSTGVEAAILTNSWTLGPMLGFLGGIQPDGDIVYPKATGTAADTDTPLAGSGSYSSGLLDHDGWAGIAVTIKTDQVSASDGLRLDWYETIDGVDVMIDSTTRTFGADAVADGSQTYRFAPVADKVEVVYTNGGVAQTEFVLAVVFYSTATELPRGPLDGSVSGTSEAVMTRGALIAPEAVTGAWTNLTRRSVTDLDSVECSALDVNISGITAESRQAPLDSVSGSALTTLGTIATQVASSPPANTKVFTFHSDSSNTKVIYLSNTMASATFGSAMYELPAGSSVTIPVVEGQAFWAVATGAGQTLRWMYGVRA